MRFKCNYCNIFFSLINISLMLYSSKKIEKNIKEINDNLNKRI
jgi:hypothetical protein